jgi:hypothetical protein
MEQAGNAGAGTQRVRKATGRFKASSGRGGKLAKEKEEASGVMSGAFLLGGMVRRRASDRCATKRKGEMDGKSYRLYRQSISRWGVALHDAVQGEIAAPERYR